MKRIILSISAAFCLISCSLDLEPQSALTSSRYWKSADDVENTTVSAYFSLSKALAQGVYNWGELRGGNYTGNQVHGKDQYDIINDIMTSANAAANWTNLYAAIARANLVLKYAPSVSMDAASRNGYLSECYAMRALCYFYIVRVWGDAPLFLEPVEEYDPSSVFRERTDSKIILGQIVSDLEAAETYAQAVTTAAFKRSRINIMGIYAIMADVYAWMHRYDKVIGIMDKVYALAPEGSSSSKWKTLTMAPGTSQSSFNTAWRNIFYKFDTALSLDRIDKERIFYLAYDELENGTNGNTSYFCQNGTCKATPSVQLNSFFKTGDKRYGATFNTSSLLISNKFWPEGTKFGTGGIVSDTDIILYRMSDLVLLHAEALAATNRIREAVVELNKIHTRAGLSAYAESDFLSSEDALLAILRERAAELVGEGKFWFDLVRTGHAADIGGVTDPARWLFPISKTHLDQNAKLTQNEGYATGE